MLRLKDVSRVIWRDDDAYHHRAVTELGGDLATFECDDDARVRDLLTAASDRADIFSVHLEVCEGEPLIVGRLVNRRKKSFDMHFVGRDGTWATVLDRPKYRNVTRIDVGGRYLDALNAFAEPWPGAPEAVTHA